ncbi:hypothetical protein EBME_0296 [bacterium endosymbiont of Mortierella elongata FMR23-6]|nr:hypothetical protein EBME_0296 [bacterium endosymbiont of Mortierella elongata FMR23-6]
MTCEVRRKADKRLLYLQLPGGWVRAKALARPTHFYPLL